MDKVKLIHQWLEESGKDCEYGELPYFADAIFEFMRWYHCWVDVKETMPREGDQVLVYINYKNRYPKIRHSGYIGGRGFTDCQDVDHLITHWTRLPEPPEAT